MQPLSLGASLDGTVYKIAFLNQAFPQFTPQLNLSLFRPFNSLLTL